MTKQTITEALAEIKTISKRIASKKTFVSQYLFRMDSVKDPLEKEGGSAAAIAAELQAIKDLENLIISLRSGIAAANEETKISIEGEERSIADWLIWRREVADGQKSFLRTLNSNLNSAREHARRTGASLVANGTDNKPTDIVVSLDEKKLSKDMEKLENILGQLDGQLSLKNATVMIA